MISLSRPAPRVLLKICWMAMLVAGIATAGFAEEQWSRFRGPNGTGASDLKGVPAQWSVSDYEWVVDLPGVGHSSPVIWGDKLFLTSADDNGNRITLCLNALTGKQLWTHSVALDTNHLHKKNSYASGSAAADAERVYVPFGDEEHFLLTAYTHDGEIVWTRDLGPYSREHGHGASPIVYEGLVIIPYDQTDGPSSVIAFDAETGETKWKTPRGPHKASYSTPMILDVPGYGTQLVNITGGSGFFGLDPKSGALIWESGRLPQRSVASPVYINGLLIGSCGAGGRGQLMIAVDPTGKGDVSATHIKAERTKSLPYVPTPVVKDNYLFLWNDDGIVYCVDINGDLSTWVWQERIGGNFSGSPVLIDDKIYCISEAGDVAVIAASPEFHLYGKSPLGDPSYATPAVANGRVYLRGFHKLAALKAAP